MKPNTPPKRQAKRKNKPLRSQITFQTLHQLAQQFTQQHPAPKPKRGRPPRYPEALILALWLFRQLHDLSYRATQALFHDLGKPVPDFSTLHYRIAHLSEERLLAFQRWLAERALHGNTPELLLVDGTGFGFNSPFHQQWRRGAEIRKVQSHIRVVAVVAVVPNGERVVVGVRLGEPYADERRLWRSWREEEGASWGWEGCYVVGDALYGMEVRGLRWVYQQGWTPVFRVGNSLWRGVRHTVRVRARRDYEAHRAVYERRYLVESLFGSLKGLCGSYCRERLEGMARRAVLGRVLLWNVGVVCFGWWCGWRLRRGFFKHLWD